MWLNPYIAFFNIDKLVFKINQRIGHLRRLHNILPKATINLLQKSLIIPHFDYCYIVWGNACTSSSVASLFVRRGKVKEPHRFWPFLPDFSSFSRFFPDFSSPYPDFSFFFPNFWQCFRCQGGHSPLAPILATPLCTSHLSRLDKLQITARKVIFSLPCRFPMDVFSQMFDWEKKSWSAFNLWFTKA